MSVRHLIAACATVLATAAAGAAETAAPAAGNAASTAAAPSAAAVRTETARLLEEQRNFELADIDGDFQLSWEEFRNFFVPQFVALDRNGDHVLSGDEHPPATSADGKPVKPRDVTAEAFQTALKIAFERADVDRSGTLSAKEWATPL
jgi:hypothetical protein